MTPGREFDALVAEKVMGWFAVERIGLKAGWGYPSGDALETIIPKYSTDIAAAWEVVDALFAKGLLLSLFRVESGSWNAGFFKSGDTEEQKVEFEYEDSASHAICQAALKTILKTPAK